MLQLDPLGSRSLEERAKIDAGHAEQPVLMNDSDWGCSQSRCSGGNSGTLSD